jgi:hypothetical protein
LFYEKIKKGFVITRNVNLYLHKPLANKDRYQTPESFVQALKDQDLIVQHEFVPNDVVDAGEIWIAELLADLHVDDSALTTPMKDGLQHIAIGTGSVAVTQNDFDLGTPIAQANASKATTNSFNAGANNKFTVSATFLTTEPTGQPYSLREAGIFAMNRNTTAPTSETQKTNRMFNRTVFSVITKTTDFELTIQWTIEIGALTA